MITLYGIKNCDTCRKALNWLSQEGVEHTFHDFRKDGLAEEDLERWIGGLGWETLLNRRGTTWRALPEAEKANVDAAKARSLMLANPTLIKRPVMEGDGLCLIGFGGEQRDALVPLASAAR